MNIDGINMMSAINLFNQALLLRKMRDSLAASQIGRVVFVGSESQTFVENVTRALDFENICTDVDNYYSMDCYGGSKLMSNLYCKSLSRKWKDVFPVSINPGDIGTGIADWAYNEEAAENAAKHGYVTCIIYNLFLYLFYTVIIGLLLLLSFD